MSTPDVPLRMDFSLELPGTPEQVWDAIATANGISSWFLPTDLEEHEGGSICLHMGEDASSPGTVTGWDPPRRFAYEEPEWAALAGHPGAPVTPIATEFLVEARSGGTCVVRVVSSAFGTGADWERECFDEMERGWTPFFDNLRLYLTHLPGQRVTSLSAQATVAGDSGRVWSAMRQALGVGEAGQSIEVRGLGAQVQGLSAQVQRLGTSPGPNELLLRLTAPVPGFLLFMAMDGGDGSTWTQIQGYLFSPDAPAYVERAQPEWKAWLQSLAVAAA